MFKFNCSAIKEHFDITDNGFLPSESVKFLTGQFVDWENVMKKLPEINKSKNIREILSTLPEFRWQDLNESWQYKRAYVILTLMTNSYVHFEDKHPEKIPAKLAVPLWNVSKYLGINPILTHAAVDLFNWDLKDKNGKFELDNLKSVSLLTGTRDEEWFYLIMVAIEKVGGDILNTFIKILVDQENNLLNSAKMEKYLEKTVENMNAINNILMRMKENCNPDIFYNVLRPYLSGWDVNGIIYEGVSDEPMKYVGGSAAQSSLFQVIDCAFNINHKDEYFERIKEYMPNKHKNFINFVKSNIKIYEIIKTFDDTKINCLFNECIKSLEKFRTLHYGIVHRYIIKMIPTGADGAKGTGGTELSSFLKQSIKETTQ